MAKPRVRVYWDSTVWVAWNKHEFDAYPICSHMLREAQAGRLQIVVGTLVLAEFVPRDRAVDDLLERFLTRSGFLTVALTKSLAEDARELVRRVKHLRGPDAVHIASAIYAKADALHTYDDGVLAAASAIPEVSIRRPDWLGQQVLALDEMAAAADQVGDGQRRRST